MKRRNESDDDNLGRFMTYLLRLACYILLIVLFAVSLIKELI